MQTMWASIIVGAWIIVLFSLVFFGLRSEFRRRKILKKGIRTKAIVINNKVSRGATSKSRPGFFYTPVVSFKLESGDIFEAKRRYGTRTRHYNVGDVLYIYYLKENPNRFIFEAGKERKENLLVLATILILVLVFIIGSRLLVRYY